MIKHKAASMLQQPLRGLFQPRVLEETSLHSASVISTHFSSSNSALARLCVTDDPDSILEHSHDLIMSSVLEKHGSLSWQRNS
jgi:hypothetical protein